MNDFTKENSVMTLNNGHDNYFLNIIVDCG